MRTLNRLSAFRLPLEVQGATTEICGLHRDGTRLPLVFLHGFGSTKEDYADIVHRAELDDHQVLAYDAPGCGESTISDPEAVSIPFLVDVARQVLTAEGISRCVFIGHSMGGLTALRLVTETPALAAGFVDIEGNLAPEDCFLSRQIVDHPRATAREFFEHFRDRVRESRYAASALYAAGLSAKVRPEVVRPIFESMVALSDHVQLLEDFLHLPFPRQLMYGEQNSALSYLDQLNRCGVELAEIADCGHFPMYSNPIAMWDRIADFASRAVSP